MMDEFNKLLKELEQYVLDRQYDFVETIFIPEDLHLVFINHLFFGVNSVTIQYEYRKTPHHFTTISRETFDNWYNNIRTLGGVH